MYFQYGINNHRFSDYFCKFFEIYLINSYSFIQFLGSVIIIFVLSQCFINVNIFLSIRVYNLNRDYYEILLNTNLYILI